MVVFGLLTYIADVQYCVVTANVVML